jgi:hypothetical protein
MWKIAVGFILFAALALFIISKGGDKIDMQGEAGTPSEEHAESAAASASVSIPAPAATPEVNSASK